MRPLLGRQKQRGEPAIRILAPQQRVAIVIGGHERAHQGTASKAAADPPVLGQEDRIGARRGARRHRLRHNAHLAQSFPQAFLQGHQRRPGPDQEMLDQSRRLIEDGRKRTKRNILRRDRVPGLYAGRQSEDRAAMRHAGEAKAAGAIAFDDMAAGEKACIFRLIHQLCGGISTLTLGSAPPRSERFSAPSASPAWRPPALAAHPRSHCAGRDRSASASR